MACGVRHLNIGGRDHDGGTRAPCSGLLVVPKSMNTGVGVPL